MKKQVWLERMRGKSKFAIALYIFVRLSVLLALVLALVRKEYFQALQAALALILFYVPDIIDKKLHLHVPNLLECLIILFIYASVFLGEFGDFYYRFPNWDMFLHGSSGFAIAGIGFSLVNILNRSDKVAVQLSPFFVSFFSVCFTTFIGVAWEIYEYCMDLWFGMDMQKGTMVAGVMDSGLIDTMEDMMIDTAGALLFAVIGFFYIKYYTNGKLNRLLAGFMLRPKTKAELALEEIERTREEQEEALRHKQQKQQREHPPKKEQLSQEKEKA